MNNLLKRSLALFLALIMCIGMLPISALAEGEEAESAEPVHEHSWSDWTVVTAATCSSAGSQQRSCACGAVETAAIAALPHSFGEWTVTREATCTAAGEQQRSCTVCGTVETAAIAALPHSYGEWTVVTPATCTEAGVQEHVCSVCGASETEAIAKVPHSYGAWTVTKEASCTEEGVQEHICTVCGASETEAIAKVHHSYGAWTVTREASCTEEGVQEHICTVCGASETEAVAKVPHEFGEWTVTRETTCSKEGEQEHTCEVCGEVVKEAIPTLPHEFGEWTVLKEATCSKEGKQEHTCEVCGEVVNEAIPTLPHEFGEWKVIKEATCTKAGKREHTCEVCGEVVKEEIPVLDHDLGPDGKCKDCGAIPGVYKPAQTLNAELGDVRITVEVPAGRIPEGSKVNARSANIQPAAAQAALGKDVKQVFSVILTYTDKENNVVNPGKVSVTVRVINQDPDCTYRAFRTINGIIDPLGSETAIAKAKFSKSDFTPFGVIEIMKPVVIEEEPADGEEPAAPAEGEVPAEGEEPVVNVEESAEETNEDLEVEELDGDDYTIEPEDEEAEAENEDNEDTIAEEVEEEEVEEVTEEELEPGKVTVVFIYGEEEIASVEYAVGDVIGTLPEAPNPGSAYFFKGWFAGSDKVSDSTIVEEAMTVEAVFDYMPASNGVFIRNTSRVSVSVSWGEGTFPEGVDPVVTDVSNAEAIAQGVLTEENVTGAIAFDLTFFDKAGNEVQPANDNSVRVSVSFRRESLEGDSFTILHETDGGYEKVDGDASATKASFEGDSFSVYVVVVTVVPRLTVKFMNGSTEVATMYVKKADTAAEVEKIINDPGAGTVPTGQVFKGWTTDQNYTVTTLEPEDTDYPFLTIAQVRSDAMTRAAALTTEDGEVIYYAAMFKQFTVTYVNGEGITVGSEVLEIPSRMTEGSYTVNQGYTTDDSHNFEGWIVADGKDNIKNYPEGAKEETIIVQNEDEEEPITKTIYYYENDTVITITGDVQFSVNAPEGHWLVFNENGSGATYVAPQFVKTGEVTKAPTLPMKRYGYTFDWWYSGKEEIVTDPETEEKTTIITVYTDQPFTFGDPIDETTKIYANWIPADQAKYTVLIWLENLAGDDYDFAEAVNLEGATNGTASAAVTVSGTPKTGASYVTVDEVDYNGANKPAFKGFHYDHMEANNEDTIVPEGTTIVNVYYKRTEYTLKFYYARSQAASGQYQYTAVATTSNNGTPSWNSGYSYDSAQEYFRNDNGQRAYYRNGRFYSNPNGGSALGYYTIYIREALPEVQSFEVPQVRTADGVAESFNGTGGSWAGNSITQPGSSYGGSGSETRGSYTYYYRTLTAKYGTYIGNVWPTYNGIDFAVWTSGSTTYRQGSWAVMRNSQAYIRDHQGTIKGKITIMDEEILGDLTSETGNYLFANYDTTSSQYSWVYHIYFENDDGQYELYENIDALSHDSGSNWQTQQHPPAYEGMTEVESKRERVGNNREINYYYTRDLKTLTYLDGVYVNGNGHSVNGKSPVGELRQITGIPYGAEIGKYGKGGSEYFVPTTDNVSVEAFDPTGFVFGGWYSDKECTHEYEFVNDQGNSKTMPEGGITVYAKWVQVQYRVFLHPNADGDNTLNWGSETQKMTFRGSYGEKISVPTGKRTGYDFYGWYMDESFNKVFTENMALNDSIVTKTYDKTTDMTDPMDKWGNGATWNSDVQDDEGNPRDRFWITKKLDLYAKWSEKVIGAEGIGVIYDSNGGGTAPTDTALYKDNTKVSAGAATTPPAKKVFDHWVVQTWNGTQYVDTATTVLAGETFTALKSNARITDASSGATVAPENVVDDAAHHYRYTIQLKAVYKDIEEENPTHIVWYSNFGTENDGKGTEYRYDKKDSAGKNVLKINEAVSIYGLGTGESIPTRTGYTFKGWTKTQGGTEANFLVYSAASGYKDTAGNAATQVAADEKQPIEDLYAVWRAIQYTVIFDKNAEDATGSMNNQVFQYDEQKALTKNDYSRTNYTFLGWSTDPNATTATYTDEKVVKNLTSTDGDEITLYAVWKNESISITIHHYLYDTTNTKVAADQTGVEVTVGGSYTPTAATVFIGDYAGKNLTPDPAPTAVDITESTTEINLYYKINITIVATTGSKQYDGTPLNGGYTISGELSADTAIITSALGTAPSITNVNDGPKNYLTETEQEAITGIPSYYAVGYTPGTLTITKRSVTMTSANDTKEYDGQPLTNHNVTETGDGFIEGEGATYDVTGSQTEVGGEANNNTFTYTLNEGTLEGNYDITPVYGTLTVTKSSKVVSITSADGSKKYDGTKLTAPTYTVKYGNTAVAANEDGTFTLPTGDTLTITDTSNVIHVADTAANNNTFSYVLTNESRYETVTPTYGTLTVTTRSVTMTSATDTKEYDGQPLTNDTITVTGDGFIEGEGAAYDVTGSQTEIGGEANNNTFTYTLNEGTTATDYSITPVCGTLTVTASSKVVSITSADGSKKYDGTKLTAPTYTVKYGNTAVAANEDGTFTLPTGDTLTITDTSNVVHVADTAANNNTFSYVLTNESRYETVTPTYGTLTVTTRSVTMTSATDTKEYDGQPLTNHNVTETGDGFIEGEGAAYDVTGSQTEVGGEANNNTFTYTLNEGTTATDYSITPVKGTLTVTKISKAITITSGDNTWEYDGNDHSEETYTVTFGDETATADSTGKVFTLSNGDTVTISNPAKVKNVSDSAANNNTFTYALTNADRYETVTTVYGTLTITKASINVGISGHNGTLIYNGAEQSVTGYDASIPAGATLTAAEINGPDAIAAGTNVDGGSNADKTYPMGLKAEDFSTNNSNYNVTFTISADGWLKITKATMKITAIDQGYAYTGNPLGETNATYTDAGTIATKVKVEGLKGSDKLTSIKLDGTATNVGEYAGRIVPSEAALGNSTANYDITYVAGKLTIRGNAPGLTLTLTPTNYNDTYDGLTHFAFVTPNIQNGTTIWYIVNGVQTNNPPSSKDVTNMTVQVYATNPTYGDATATVRLVISPAHVTVTGDGWDGDQQYTGNEYSKNTYTVTGVVNGETATITYSISGTERGDYTGTFGNDFKVTKADGSDSTNNYTLSTVPGTLTIGGYMVAGGEAAHVNTKTDPENTGDGIISVIEEPDVPLAAPSPVWALLNLILGIITVIVGALMSLSLIKKPKENEDEKETVRSNPETEEEDKKRKKSKLLGIIPAVVAVITFILTEDMRNPMVFTDKWTILMAIYAVVGGVLAYFTRNKKDDDKKDDEEAKA